MTHGLADIPSSGGGGGPGSDTTAIHDNVAGEIVLITEKVSPVGADIIIIEDSADSDNKKRVQITNLPSGGGEVNTASNVGTAGVGVFKQKIGVDLEFKKVNAGSSKVTVTDDVGNNEVDIDIIETNITHNNLGGIGADDHHDEVHGIDSANHTGTLSIGKGGTGQTTQTTAFNALSPNTTKGDMIVNNGTNDIREPVGTDGQIIEADSAQASGINYVDKPVFGNEYEYDESEGLSTTTSSTYINKLSLVTAALTAGNYRIGWAAEISHTNIADATGVQVTVNAVVINEPEIEPKDTNNWYSIGAFKQMNLTGSQTINIDFREQRGTTAEIRRARIEIWRVS